MATEATAPALTDSDFESAPAVETPKMGVLSDADFAAEPGNAPTVSEAPVPKATTYLSDRNLVVAHPADMSHDQVNDAIQTHLYGRPRNDFHQDASPLHQAVLDALKTSLVGLPFHVAEAQPPTLSDLKAVAPEAGKGVVRGVENIGVGMAGLVKWAGEGLDHVDLAKKVGDGLKNISDTAITYLKTRQEKGFEAPDPEIFRGSYVSNPSFARLAASVAQGVPSLAAAAALTIGTGNPLLGAGALGLVGAGEQYESSRKEGSSVLRGTVAAAASGVGNTLLMSLPLGKALEGFGPTIGESAVKGAAEFAGVTAVMTPFNNIVAKIGGDKSRKLFEGMTESLLSAAVSGGLLGALTPGHGAQIDDLIQEAHKDGVPAKDIDAARAEIAKQMVENPEAVTGAIKESKVYTDIKDQLLAIKKPETMTPEEWQSNIESGAQLWAARVANEAQKRGETVETAYARMRPTIEGEPAMDYKKISRIELKYDTDGIPKRRPNSVVSTVTTPEGEPVKITHQMVLNEAEGLQQEGRPEQTDPVLDFIRRHRISPGVGLDWEALPLNLKGKKNGWNPNKILEYINENPGEFGRAEGSEFTIDDLSEAVQSANKPDQTKPSLAGFYDRALSQLENHFSNFGKPYQETEVAPGVFFQKPEPGLFGEPTENIGDRYERLRQQALDQGLNPVQASRFAKDHLGNTQQYPTDSLPKQTEFDAGGVDSFGKGKEGEKELFQRSPEAPVLEEKALKTFGETAEINKAGFILPDGKMVDFTMGGEDRLFMHQDISKIYQGTGTIGDETGLLHDFMGKTGAVRLSNYDDIGGKHLSIEAHGPLSEEQIRNIGDFLGSGKVSTVTFETVNEIGRPIRAKSYDQPTGEDLARFFNGSSNYFQTDFQGSQAKPRGATSFTPEKTIIRLFRHADESTFLHESAHAWLQDIHNFAVSGKADERYMADWHTMADWLGIGERKELSTDAHEKFARAFESYARNGVAPTPQLQGAFDKFKDWLSKIYRSAQDLKVDVPDNVRGLLDGMFRSETPDTANNLYVKNIPFDIAMGPTDASTARNIREEFSGIKNEQIVRGNQLAEEIKQIVPDIKEREGMFWYKAAKGDMNVLADALSDPKLAAYHDQINAAMNLSSQATQALSKANQYYEEAGRVSQEIGTIKSVLENYQNRIYAPDKPQDFVKTETKSGIKQSTKHALRRVFDTEFEAAQAGKTFATTDVADSLAIHNEELARVNTARKMANALADAGLGAWKKEIPDGWKQVGELKKSVPIKDKEGNAVIGEDGNQAVSHSLFVAPEGIAKGLAAISDPNFAKKIDSVRGIQRYQGLVKTVDLSFSFFHHFSMAMQSLYQGGFRTLLNLPTMQAHLDTPEFKEIEQDFVKHTGMTAKVEANQDILRHLIQNQEDAFSKVSNLPVVKNILSHAEKSTEFLFGKVQRFLKVSDYGEKISNWVGDHPNATNEEVVAAKKGFAKQINAVYGGLNWEAMGMTKSNLSLLRIAMLAPDWTISNVELLRYALADSGTAGKSSRSHIVMALTTGMILTEGMNKLLTGHFTDENKSGHKLEVEISPGVYVSFLRGGIGDITKFSSMVSESGLQGVSRFAQGKLAPFPRTAVGLLTNTQYTGRAIGKKAEGPIANTYDVMKYLVSSLAPMPLGVSNFFQYLQDHNATPQGAAAVLTGVGRYSKSGKSSGLKI